MVTTVQSLGLLLTLVVPGAVATLGYERHSGAVGGDSADRLVRYVFGTAVMAPFSLAVVWYVWTRLLHVAAGPHFFNRLDSGGRLSPAWLLLPLPYLLVPWTCGSALGALRTRYFKWYVRRHDVAGRGRPKTRVSRFVRSIIDRRRSVVPVSMTGWDVLFLEPGPKLVSLRLRDGTWIGGLFGAKSFASPRAAESKEMVLEMRVRLDQDGVIETDALGTPFPIGGAVRVFAADVDLIVVTPG